MRQVVLYPAGIANHRSDRGHSDQCDEDGEQQAAGRHV